MIKKNNILVTGGAGYIGSHIVEKLNHKKFNIIILDNLITGYERLINKKPHLLRVISKMKIPYPKLLINIK